MFSKLPSLTSIRTFEASARLLSFKDAADELNVSPTAVSHQIRNLEQELGVKLFERKTREVQLTNDGHKLFESAHEVMKRLKATINEIVNAPKTLTVGTTNAFAAMWLVPNITSFQQRHPSIDVQIKADDKPIDFESERQVDFVIRSGKLPQNNANAVSLHKETLKLYATPIFWENFLKDSESCVLFHTRWKNKSLEQPDLQSVVKSLEKKPAKLVAFDDENQTIQAALSGSGIALASELLASKPVAFGWLMEAPQHCSIYTQGLEHYCVIPEWNKNSEPAQFFKAWLLDELSSKPL